MSGYFPSVAKVTPSYSEPGLILTWTQVTGAFELLPGGNMKTTLGQNDKFVYVSALDVRTDAGAAQSAFNLLPSATFSASLYSTPTYLLATRAIYDHHQVADAAEWNVSLPKAQELGSRQGIFQFARTALLYGINPTNGEGLLNSANATNVTLPPDPWGNDTTQSYDNGAMAFWLGEQVQQCAANMFMSGKKAALKVTIAGPQRVVMPWITYDIVQVTSYQREGAGTENTGTVLQNILGKAGYEVEFTFDDTLEGKGAGGTDMVVLSIPEIVDLNPVDINTNEFAELMPSIKDVNAMYTDMVAPRKISTPIPDGGVNERYEQRITSGWNLRPEGLFLLSMPYT
ncbi:DUF2184 domain-containing protein [Dyella caseinilytica]|uniref:DUF2184 domain-containing protein n=1 Tax=Dyella caseinilytica TaxID=1849581 RepID=A0ABX7GXQ8_9GAMM|nr:DUF2184 domain-containing protein [Dyella caseinilytica]QRN55249.1 DUF2184 domain-containing protein [Dyella caseinilytica]GGA00408.1 hypothetical protein GCM10011408_21670 [Dyella caseinilytica]